VPTLKYLKGRRRHLQAEENADLEELARCPYVYDFHLRRRGRQGVQLLLVEPGRFRRLTAENPNAGILFVDGTWGIFAGKKEAKELFGVPQLSGFLEGGYQVTTLLTIGPNGRSVALAHAVQPRHTQQDYESVFEALRELEYTPRVIMSDFETAIRNAVATVWPTALSRCCLFHYMQACERWHKKKHAAAGHTARWPKVRALLRAMARAPNEAAFRRAFNAFMFYATKSDKALAEYFTRTWIKMHSPRLWSRAFATDPLVRAHSTNNVCESHNSAIQRLCPGGRVSLIVGVRHLGAIQEMLQLQTIEDTTAPVDAEIDPTLAVELLDETLARDVAPINDPAVIQRSTTAAPRDVMMHVNARVALNSRQLILGPDNMAVNGECFFEAVVVAGGGPPNATAATERSGLVEYIMQLPEHRMDDLFPFITNAETPDAHTWLAHLQLRTTFVGEVEIRLWAEWRGRVVEIVADDNGRVTTIVPPQIRGEQIAILHQRGDQHYIGLVRQRRPTPVLRLTTPTVQSTLKIADRMATQLLEEAKQKEKEQAESDTSNPKGWKGRKREKVIEELVQTIVKQLRNGEDPQPPAVDGTLVATALKNAREARARWIEARDRAQALVDGLAINNNNSNNRAATSTVPAALPPSAVPKTTVPMSAVKQVLESEKNAHITVIQAATVTATDRDPVNIARTVRAVGQFGTCEAFAREAATPAGNAAFQRLLQEAKYIPREQRPEAVPIAPATATSGSPLVLGGRAGPPPSPLGRAGPEDSRRPFQDWEDYEELEKNTSVPMVWSSTNDNDEAAEEEHEAEEQEPSPPQEEEPTPVQDLKCALCSKTPRTTQDDPRFDEWEQCELCLRDSHKFCVKKTRNAPKEGEPYQCKQCAPRRRRK
jgi:hypothetical protein